MPNNPRKEPLPTEHMHPHTEKLTDVFEVHGRAARSRGWDFMVYTDFREAIDAVALDADGLEPGDEVRIVFQRYTSQQMEDVVYE